MGNSPPNSTATGTRNGDHLRVVPALDDHRSYDLQGSLRLNDPDAVCRSVRRLLGIKNVSYNEATACLGVTLDPNGSWDDVHRHIIDLIEADLGHTVSIHMEPSTIHED